MELALGVLGWPPSEFWRATPAELLFAARGYQRRKGGDPDKAENNAPMGRTRYEQLKDELGIA